MGYVSGISIPFQSNCNTKIDKYVVDENGNNYFLNPEPINSVSEKYSPERDILCINSSNQNSASQLNDNKNQESWFHRFWRMNVTEPFNHLLHPSKWTLSDLVVYSGGGVLPV